MGATQSIARGARHLCQILPKYHHATFVGLKYAGEDAEQSRFAATAWTVQENFFTPGDRKSGNTQHGLRSTVGKNQLLDVDGVIHSRLKPDAPFVVLYRYSGLLGVGQNLYFDFVNLRKQFRDAKSHFGP